MEYKINLHFLKKIPIEAYVLVVFPVLAMTMLLFFDPKIFPNNKALAFYLLYYGNKYFVFILALLFAFFLSKILFSIFQVLIAFNKDRGTNKRNIAEFKNLLRLLKDAMYAYLIVYTSGFFSSLLLNSWSYSINKSKVVQTSTVLLNYDYSIFGRDLLFWLNGLVNAIGGNILSNILIQCYSSLINVSVVFMIILLLYNKMLLKKFILFFFILLFISIPVWYIIPGQNPLNFYINNLLKTDPPTRVSQELKSYTPDATLNSYQKSFSYHYTSKDFLDVTTFPSMHAGFSVGIIIYAFILWPPSVFITVPWFMIEMLGALYTGQHYAVDLFLGSIMAVLAYQIVESLYFLEKKYYTGSGSFFIIDTIQKDVKEFFKVSKKIE